MTISTATKPLSRKLEFDLSGRTVVVTGGGGAPGRGMGREISLQFSAAGANVVVVDISPDTANLTVETIKAEGGNAISVQADVASASDIERVGQAACDAFGVVDILVNHVGIGNNASLLDTTEEWWDRCQAVNLKAPFLTARQFLPGMLMKGKGVIVNTISICGLTGGRAGPAYTAAKHGLIGLTKNIAACYGDRGIRCVGIAPGGVRGEGPEWNSAEGRVIGTDEQPNLWPSLRRALDLNPRRGTPGEVAPAVLFLASDHASFINGAVLPIDAGWTAV
jgi:NAD(P)-dependent dehydrogenase (short-subunit alcohol dehydrogenase family)